MDMSKYAGKSFVKVDDVRAGPVRKVIERYGVGKKYDKPELTFEDGDVLSLNATNVRTLIRHYGKDGRMWLGATVELVLGKVEYRGSLQDSVLVKPISPPRSASEPLPPEPEPEEDEPEPERGNVTTMTRAGKRDDMDDEIPF